MERVITNSMRNTFLECPHKFFLEYIQRWTPIEEAEYFTWGDLVHQALHCYAQGEDFAALLKTIREKEEKALSSLKRLERIERLLALLPRVMDAYLLKWYEYDQRFESLGGEEQGGKFALPLPCGWLFKGKIDGIKRDTLEARITTIEHKTAASFDDDHLEDYFIDSQPIGYLLACQRYFGIQANTVLYDFICKPQIKQKKWQTKEAYVQEVGDYYIVQRDKFFQRRSLTFEQEVIDAYYYDIDQVAQMIEWCMIEGIYPKNHSRNRKGGCDFRSICLRGDYSHFYVRPADKLNPELVD